MLTLNSSYYHVSDPFHPKKSRFSPWHQKHYLKSSFHNIPFQNPFHSIPQFHSTIPFHSIPYFTWCLHKFTSVCQKLKQYMHMQNSSLIFGKYDSNMKQLAASKYKYHSRVTTKIWVGCEKFAVLGDMRTLWEVMICILYGSLACLVKHRHDTTLHYDPSETPDPLQIQTRAPRGTDRSPEYNEHFCYKLDSRVKNLTTEWNQKQQHFITHASRSLLWIRFVAVAFRSEEKVFWRRTSPPPLVTYFASHWIHPLGKYGQNIFMHVPGHGHFIPTKFRKHPLSDSHGGCG